MPSTANGTNTLHHEYHTDELEHPVVLLGDGANPDQNINTLEVYA